MIQEEHPVNISRLEYHFFIRSLVKKPKRLIFSQFRHFLFDTKKTLLWIHIQGWVQLLFSIPGRRRCKWVQFTEIVPSRHPPPPPPAGTQTVSSRLKYFCCASLRLCPIQLMHHLIQHNSTVGGLPLDGLLMSYRFSLLPWWFTMHSLPFHQIFSMCRLLLMLRRLPKWIQGFWEVKDH